MKAKSIILIALLACFVACSNNPETLVKNFEQALEACDYKKARKIANKIDKLGADSFTDEQLDRIADAIALAEYLYYNYDYDDFDEEPDCSVD